ncbi:MAG: hypothetical protein OEY14_14075, partial [Myxococcales bacterium]|nr:hypothetical protein [Myxococcales bacterium]
MPRSAASSSTSARPGRLALLFGAATLLLSACGGDDGPPGLGEGCNPDTADVCGADAVCSLDAEGANVCQKPAGAECDLTATKTHCILG